jgi:taurine dioxygenase
MNITPLGPAIGAVVAGIDLTRSLGDEEIARLRSALLDHQVLFFEEQPVTARQQRDLAARFGPLRRGAGAPQRPSCAAGVHRALALEAP